MLLCCALVIISAPPAAFAGSEKPESEEKVKIVEKEKIVEVEAAKADFSGRAFGILVNYTLVQVVDAWKPLWGE